MNTRQRIRADYPISFEEKTLVEIRDMIGQFIHEYGQDAYIRYDWDRYSEEDKLFIYTWETDEQMNARIAEETKRYQQREEAEFEYYQKLKQKFEGGA